MRRRSYLPALAGSFAIVLVLALVFDAVYDGSSSAKATVIGSTTYLEEKLDELVFPKDKVIDVRVTIDEEDFQDMLSNAAAEEVKPASVEYNGIKLNNIGFRTKGNLSLSSVVNSDSDRYSFKLHLDEYISSQSLYGVHAINLNNSFSDPTYMREVLAYEMAEQLGLPTPKYSYVNLYINDELWGFYLAVEQIGNSYLERHFGDATGSLYKAVMGNGTDLAWVNDSRESYSALVQKSDYADEDALINMIYELNNGSDYEQVLDVENVLKYIALNVVTSNSDSYIGQTKHNYYLYEQNGVFSVLPWDYNMAFGGMGNMGLGGRGGGRGGGFGGFGGDMNMGQTEGGEQAQGAMPDAQQGVMQDGQLGAAANVGGRRGFAGRGRGNMNMGQVVENNLTINAVPGAQQGDVPNFGNIPLEDQQDAAPDTREYAIPNFGGGFGGRGGNISVYDPAGGLDRPLIDELLAVPEYLEMYTGYVREALEGYLATDTFNSRVDEWADLIREYVKQDPRPFYSYEQFESGIESLKTTNADNVAKYLQELEEGVQTTTESNDTTANNDTAANNKIAANDVTIAQFTADKVTTALVSMAQFQTDGGENGQLPPGGMGDGQFPPGGMGDGQRPQPPAGDGQFPQDGNANGQTQQGGVTDGQAQQEGNVDGQFPIGDMGNGQFPGIPAFPGADGQGGGNFPGFGGGGFPGNMQGTTAATSLSDDQLEEELIEIGISLGVLALAAVFIVTFKRRRL